MAFKPNTNIVTGSPARLSSAFFDEKGLTHTVYDPHASSDVCDFSPGVYFVATKYEESIALEFTQRSVVIDSFRYTIQRGGVTLIRIGEYSEALQDL